MSENSISNPRKQWIVASHLVLPNGPAHRFFNLLQTKYEFVGFCGVPLPGAEIARKELIFPSSSGENTFLNVKKRSAICHF